MLWAQWTILVLLLVGFGIDSAKHGTTTTDKHNVLFSLVTILLQLALFYCAGTFDLIFR